ncbi:MAG: hypothetical protein JWM13_3008 [Arthrobacter sp.]|nr:hypothetical protein [Arthrobacter sp.]
MLVQSPDLPLLVQRILAQQRTTIAAAATQALDSYGNPAAGSAAFRDQEWARQHEHKDAVVAAFAESAGTVASLLAAADEYCRGIMALLDDDQMLPLPAMNCVRAIHDASLRICSLVEPGISAEARLACSAADFLATVQGGIPLLRIFNESLGGRGDLQRGLKGRDGAVEHFIGVGLEVKLNGKGDALHVRCGGSVANINVKSTDLSLKYTPRIHYAWGLNSGATHSSPWLMHGLSGPWSQMLVSMISPLLDISDALATNLLGYVGLPSDEVRRSTHTRRLLLVDRYGRDGRPFVHHETYHRGS